MDYSKITVFQLTKAQMDYSSERQDLISKNIANIDTPGFTPRDLKKLDFDELVNASTKKLKMRLTSDSHKVPDGQESLDYKITKQRKTFEKKPVKNNVSIEEQMMKMNENSIDYINALNVYNKNAQLFRTAIGKQ